MVDEATAKRIESLENASERILSLLEIIVGGNAENCRALRETLAAATVAPTNRWAAFSDDELQHIGYGVALADLEDRIDTDQPDPVADRITQQIEAELERRASPAR